MTDDVCAGLEAGGDGVGVCACSVYFQWGGSPYVGSADATGVVDFEPDCSVWVVSMFVIFDLEENVRSARHVGGAIIVRAFGHVGDEWSLV